LFRHLLAKLLENAIAGAPTDLDIADVYLRAFLEPACLVLEIWNYVPPEDIEKIVGRVRRGLDGDFEETRGHSDGYGLYEAHRCCALLGIRTSVDFESDSSRIVITLRMKLAEGM